jgi:hypothetical protein
MVFCVWWFGGMGFFLPTCMAPWVYPVPIGTRVRLGEPRDLGIRIGADRGAVIPGVNPWVEMTGPGWQPSPQPGFVLTGPIGPLGPLGTVTAEQVGPGVPDPFISGPGVPGAPVGDGGVGTGGSPIGR